MLLQIPINQSLLGFNNTTIGGTGVHLGIPEGFTFSYFSSWSLEITLIYIAVLFALFVLSGYIIGKEYAWWISLLGFVLQFSMLLGAYDTGTLDAGSGTILLLLTVACMFKLFNDLDNNMIIADKRAGRKYKKL